MHSVRLISSVVWHMFSLLQAHGRAHEYATAQTGVSTDRNVVAGFFAGVIYFRITVHYFYQPGYKQAQVPVGCGLLKRLENQASTNTRSFIIFLCCFVWYNLVKGNLLKCIDEPAIHHSVQK